MAKGNFSKEYYTDPNSGVVFVYKSRMEPQTWKAIHNEYQNLRHPKNNRLIRQMTFTEILRNVRFLEKAKRHLFSNQCFNSSGVVGNTLALNIPQSEQGLRSGIYTIDRPNLMAINQLTEQSQKSLEELAQSFQDENRRRNIRGTVELFDFEEMKIRFAPHNDKTGALFTDYKEDNNFFHPIYDALTDDFNDMKTVFPHSGGHFEGWLVNKKNEGISMKVPWIYQQLLPPDMIPHSKLYISTGDGQQFFSYGIQEPEITR